MQSCFLITVQKSKPMLLIERFKYIYPMKPTSLYFYFGQLTQTQEYLTQILTNYSKLGRFTNRYQPVVVFCNEIAISLNATLTLKIANIGRESAIFSAMSLSFPTIIPFVSLWETDSWQNLRLHSTGFNDTYGIHSKLHRTESLPQSFVYCDYIKTFETSKLEFFTVFVQPFHFWAAVALALSYLIVSSLVTLDRYIQTNQINYGLSLLVTFSSMLSPILGSTVKFSDLSRCKLLFLWLFGCSVVSNFYSGLMTSEITRPLQIPTINNLDELDKGKFHILYYSKEYLQRDMDMAYLFNRTSLGNLLKRGIFIRKEDIARELATGLRRAYIYSWGVILNLATSAQKLIQSHAKIYCHVGSRLIDRGPYFYAILPPNTEKVSRAFTTFFEAGIYNFWIHEYYGLSHSDRIQDRNKVVGMTKLSLSVEVDGMAPTAISLGSKMASAFYLWGMCLLTSLVVFSFERIRHYMEHHRNHFVNWSFKK